MKRYFATSDIHSFYVPFKEGLKNAGFDESDPDHVLIVCGDVFDRGDGTMEVYRFFKSLPKGRLVLIKGNHESLFKELLKKTYPDRHDFSNGTVKTFCSIAGVYGESDVEKSYDAWNEVLKRVKKSEVAEWVRSDEWVDYLELGRYVFVHSFIPTALAPKIEGLRAYWPKSSLARINGLVYDPDWRKASPFEWEEATWCCPYELFDLGLFGPETEKGKTLVCGHWHSYGFKMHYDGIEYKSKEEIDFTPYISRGLIALDGCTALSGICNVLPLDIGEGDQI